MASYQGCTRFDECGLTFLAFHNNSLPPELWALDPVPLYLNLFQSLGSMLFLSKTSCDMVSTSKHQLQSHRMIEFHRESKNLLYPPNCCIHCFLLWNLKPGGMFIAKKRHEILALNFETYLLLWFGGFWWWINTENISESIGHISRIQSTGFIFSFQHGTGAIIFSHGFVSSIHTTAYQCE